MEDESKILAWFLGPKSENEKYLEEMLSLILRDYSHWRRNYFPGDKILISKCLQRTLETEFDKIYQNLDEMIAELRRNFPFYSPRYNAHMLSDTLLPSLLGYFAGMLYNPNNVTTEAAPVTVDLEIVACNEILKMIGFNPSPSVPKSFDKESIKSYKKALESEFGWAHLTLGGTTANLEALWVARSIKYSALAIRDISIKEDLSLDVKYPNGESQDIKKMSAYEILLIRPNEAIYLLSKFINAFRKKKDLSLNDATAEAQELLNSSEYSLSKGYGKIFSEFPCNIFVSGTAHYSISKAADILGVGRDNIVIVNIDDSFRIDVKDLEDKINYSLAQQKIPLAIIPIVGTTEEGAVDPVHDILDLRDKFENERKVSFWIHADAAWGGYLRSLFNFTMLDEIKATIEKISGHCKIEIDHDIKKWTKAFFNSIKNNIGEYAELKAKEIKTKEEKVEEEKTKDTLDKGNKLTIEEISQQILVELENKLTNNEEKLLHMIERQRYDEYLSHLRKFVDNFKFLKLDNVEPYLSLLDRIELVNEFVSDNLRIHINDYLKEIEIMWGTKSVCSSLIALSKVDSVTLDPHKLGYINYPSGMITFKNDRVRHFILQKAPYITSVKQDILVHMPPKHIDNIEDKNPKVVIEAFAPFIVEGSRPGAAAASLWLSLKTVTPTFKESGAILKSSLLGTRELYEWLIHWDKALEKNKIDSDYTFYPLTSNPPDTNLIIFVVKKRTSNSLSKMNILTQLVYENFAIQSELGEREYSYSQPFFLSKTDFLHPVYPVDVMKKIFERIFEKTHIQKVCEDYKNEGLTVLRATVMNPYIYHLRKLSQDYVLKDFVNELSIAAEESVQRI